MELYRIMAIGEDGLEFCIDDYLYEYQLDAKIEQARENYPCAQLFLEKH